MQKIVYDFTGKTSSVVNLTAGDVAALSFTNALPPSIVTMRQARLALLAAGLLQPVNEAVTALGESAKIEWEYAATVDRASPLVAGLTAALSLTSVQLDTLFTTAAEL